MGYRSTSIPFSDRQIDVHTRATPFSDGSINLHITKIKLIDLSYHLHRCNICLGMICSCNGDNINSPRYKVPILTTAVEKTWSGSSRNFTSQSSQKATLIDC